MLELCKEILLKVSFDKLLFQKELNKALNWISSSDDQESLKKWCYSKFGQLHPEIINLAFIKK